MQHIWFWTFWHWARESFRSGALLRGPLHGIAGHWDEWFRHEASERDRLAVEQAGRSEASQRQFVHWLLRRWAPEVNPERNNLLARFVLGQLANVPPFDKWITFTRYRVSYGLTGVRAIVLADKSSGEPGDVRPVEALILPRDADAGAAPLIAEGFQAEAADLEPALRAARRALSGKGLAAFLARWIVSGRRPYPRWVSTMLSFGWIAVVGLMLLLLFGPEPGEGLFLLEAVLLSLWLGLMLVATATVTVVSLDAWRAGKSLKTRLEESQVRLRMNGELTVKGASAGLPFCLNILISLYRAYPQELRRSWLWRRFYERARMEGDSWAATGALAANARLKPVVLEPKLRACFKQGQIKHLLTPGQPEASEQSVDEVAKSLAHTAGREPRTQSVSPRLQLGFAAEKAQLRTHPCGHLAGALMALGSFACRGQVAANLFALFVSASMLVALPDLRSTLLPYPAPVAVPPASSSPYFIWVSLDTKHPQYFSVVLESDYWSNRRAEVQPRGGVTPSTRAEMHFHRLTGATTANEDDGIIWIERRHHFLTREFLPGERVGRYSIRYLSHIGHE